MAIPTHEQASDPKKTPEIEDITTGATAEQAPPAPPIRPGPLAVGELAQFPPPPPPEEFRPPQQPPAERPTDARTRRGFLFLAGGGAVAGTAALLGLRGARESDSHSLVAAEPERPPTTQGGPERPATTTTEAPTTTTTTTAPEVVSGEIETINLTGPIGYGAITGKYSPAEFYDDMSFTAPNNSDLFFVPAIESDDTPELIVSKTLNSVAAFMVYRGPALDPILGVSYQGDPRQDIIRNDLGLASSSRLGGDAVLENDQVIFGVGDVLPTFQTRTLGNGQLEVTMADDGGKLLFYRVEDSSPDGHAWQGWVPADDEVVAAYRFKDFRLIVEGRGGEQPIVVDLDFRLIDTTTGAEILHTNDLP